MLAQRSLPFALVSLAVCACGHAGAVPPREPTVPRAEKPAPPARAAIDERAEPAAPAEVRFRLCTLHPTSAHGLRTLEAVRRAGEADTFAILDKRRVPLGEAIGDVRVAGQTAWFRARRNLEVPLGPGRLPRRFAIYDVGRIIEGGQLTYLGTVDGLPVFAAAADVAAVRAELVKLLETGTDLPRLLAANAPLRASFRALEVVYVPLRPSGCVFQALVRVANPAAATPSVPAAPTMPARPAR